MPPIKITLVLLALFWPGFGPAGAEESAFSVTLAGLDGQKAVLTLADLDSLPRIKFSAMQHRASHEFEGALIGDVLAKVGAPAGKAMRGQELADVIVIEARDGYKVALDLAGTDPAMRASARVILADRMDGKPLDASTGPFQLVVEGDLRPARAVRMVSAIRLDRVR
ncbi:MAG TPA: molybdopterin-dependent oxidoreductase [Alphaproteobacteria bacterium]|nr:molybdopterin-dependent oxidoreductase [Alphaproteobacteria bacterium]